jgi:RimJ/RimL family protein N-acetyltransferase
MIETPRVILRQWRDADRAPLAALHGDARVSDWLGGPIDAAASAASMARWRAEIDALGHGFWAMERRADGVLIGMAGIRPAHPSLPFDGAPEVGWRLAHEAWGCGYASEAAAATLAFGFNALGYAAILAFTAQSNQRSQGVMRRIGMTRDPSRDFDHPSLPVEHPLRRHVVFAAARGR